jgi:O-antigen/teichoic acid export membrane protein
VPAFTLSKYKIPVTISYVNLTLGLALGILATNMHGLQAVGWLYYYLGAQQLFGFLFTMGVGTYSIKHLAGCKSETSIVRCLSLIVRHVAVVFLLSSVCLSLALIAFSGNVNDISILLLVLVLLSLIRFLVEDLLLGLGLIINSVLQAFIESVLRLILICGVSIEVEQDVLKALIISSAVPLLITSLIFSGKLKKFKLSKYRHIYSKAYYREALVIFSSHFLAIFHTRSGIVIAGWVFSPSVVGAYGLLVNISEPVLRLGTVISRFFMRAGATANNSGVIKIWKTILTVAFLAILAGMALSMSFSLIDRVFYDSSLIQFSKEFNILLIYSLSFLLVNLSANVLNGMGMSRKVFKSSLVSTTLYIILVSIASFNTSFIQFTASLSVSSVILCSILLCHLYDAAYGPSSGKSANGVS